MEQVKKVRGRNGGRKKGVPNRDKGLLLEQLRRKVREVTDGKIKDYDPLFELLKIAFDDDVDPRIKAKCHSDIAEFVHPKLKSVEVNDVTEDRHETWLVRLRGGTEE